MRRLFLRVVCWGILVAPLAGIPITLGVTRGESALKTSSFWRELTALIESQYNIPLRYQIFEGHRPLIKALKDRWIDLAFIDPAWYVREKESVAPLLQAEIHGKTNFSLFLLVHKNSLLYRVTDFPQFALLLRQPHEDMAGYYAPLGFLEKNKIPPIQKLHYLETYDSILKGVAYGKGEEVGCIPEYVWNQQLNNRILEFVRILEVLPPVPTPILVSRRGEEPKYTSLKNALISLPGSMEGIKIFEQATYSGFTDQSLSLKEFETLRDTLKRLDALYGSPK